MYYVLDRCIHVRAHVRTGTYELFISLLVDLLAEQLSTDCDLLAARSIATCILLRAAAKPLFLLLCTLNLLLCILHTNTNLRVTSVCHVSS